ncbi:MAG: hypothetical protein MHM6MM_002159 [Cercozoa sp. M6MM]
MQRQSGEVKASLQTLREAITMTAEMSREQVLLLRQVARSLQLLGRHRQALRVLDEATAVQASLVNESDNAGLLTAESDWELQHLRGTCIAALGDTEAAIDAFDAANAAQRHDRTMLALARLYEDAGRTADATDTLLEAAEVSPENPDVLTALGLHFLHQGEAFRAFDFFGKALTYDPTHARALLAAASVIQDNKDFDVALVKYRVAAQKLPHSPQVWNNVAMCFYGKRQWIAAISCLKRARYLDPLEWIIAYNLGLCHLRTQQFASACHFFTAVSNLKPTFPLGLMYLGVALAELGDVRNALSAFTRAIKCDEEKKQPLVHLNFALAMLKAVAFLGTPGSSVFSSKEQRALLRRLITSVETSDAMLHPAKGSNMSVAHIDENDLPFMREQLAHTKQACTLLSEQLLSG